MENQALGFKPISSRTSEWLIRVWRTHLVLSQPQGLELLELDEAVGKEADSVPTQVEHSQTWNPSKLIRDILDPVTPQ